MIWSIELWIFIITEILDGSDIHWKLFFNEIPKQLKNKDTLVTIALHGEGYVLDIAINIIIELLDDSDIA